MASGFEAPGAVRIVLCDPDPRWPEHFAREAARIRDALGARVRLLEHVGSTAVPGLAAKPVIDVVLEVEDAADEEAYLPPLERHGYRLEFREPGWFEHRFLKAPGPPAVHLHVFAAGCAETRRMLAFRDHLRRDAADRALYESAKRELASRPWPRAQAYADAKTAVVAAITARVPAWPGDGPARAKA